MNGLQNGLMYSDTTIVNTPWVDFSNNSTIVGWSSFTVKQLWYKKSGNIVHVIFGFEGTSNSTSTNFTVPFTNTYAATIINNGFGVDNGTAQITTITLANNSTTVTCYRYSTITTRNATWTGSGTKSMYGQFFYQINS